MLKRINGIKPTHLWYLTPRKHFLAVIKDRLGARKLSDQREKKDQLQIAAILLGSVTALLYSFGYFSPEKTLTTIIRSDPCDTKSVKESMPPCPKDCIKQPCTKP